MKVPTSEFMMFGIAILAAGIAAYQAKLTRDALALSTVINLQNRQIDACEGFLRAASDYRGFALAWTSEQLDSMENVANLGSGALSEYASHQNDWAVAVDLGKLDSLTRFMVEHALQQRDTLAEASSRLQLFLHPDRRQTVAQVLDDSLWDSRFGWIRPSDDSMDLDQLEFVAAAEERRVRISENLDLLEAACVDAFEGRTRGLM